MFECSACTLRCLGAIASDTLATSRPHARLLLTPRRAPPQRRAASTAVATASASNGEPYLNAAQLRHLKPDVPEAQTAEALLEADKESHAAGLAQRAAARALSKELQYLPDPIKLAEHVRYTLRCNDADKALALVRLASKTRSCVVAWNHIVNWYMQRGYVNDALRIYNEMKKRAQFPDSYTYMLVLRGLVGRQERGIKTEVKEEWAVKAVSIYNSMTAPASRVPPATMHTNAALKVCSFAKDMDGFWGIASRIPEHGPGAADCITYSIILNAIRHSPEASADSDSDQHEPLDPQMQKGRRRAVEEGKRVWQEVLGKWRAGQVEIDEQLVCAMARVLLLSDRLADWDDVLNLIHQTMNIDRLLPALGSLERETGHVPGQGAHMDAEEEDYPTSEGEQSADPSSAPHPSTKNTPYAKTFHPIKPLPSSKSGPLHRRGAPQPPTTLPYVRPGNDTLSTLLETCSLMRTPKTATAYWTLLTSPAHNLQPDLSNFHSQIKLLGQNRASGRTAHLVCEGLVQAGLRGLPVTYRMALGVCQRDMKNPRVLEYAGMIVRAMEEGLEEVDVGTLGQYLGLAVARGDGAGIVGVLEELEGRGVLAGLGRKVGFGSDRGEFEGGDGVVRAEGDRFGLRNQQTRAFFWKVVEAIEGLMKRGLVAGVEGQKWQRRRADLVQFLRKGGEVKGGGRRGKVLVREAEVRGEREDVRSTGAAEGGREMEGRSPGGLKREGSVKSLMGGGGGFGSVFWEGPKSKSDARAVWGEQGKRVVRRGDDVGRGARAPSSEFADSPSELGM
ncbi:hypothetical protein LTR08_008594 [Meristemomyces frigidus]|nr:hypothetical protein LTR08_008594 [Meristemomyces frigidus]